jgi:hypothetical protein
MSNEMPTVLVGLVHLHDCAFVNEGLLFFVKSVRLAKLADANADRLVSVNGCFRVAFSVLSGPVKKAYDNCIAEFRKKAKDATIDYKVLKDIGSLFRETLARPATTPRE